MTRNFDFSSHALKRLMLRREIDPDWVEFCLDFPERVDKISSGKWYFYRRIPEFGNRVLKVVVNPLASPPRVVTVYFDRSLFGKI